MTTSIDPSVDELLLLQENQYQLPNFVFANIKPIGAERKIGQPTNTSNQIKSSLLSPQRRGYQMNMDFVSRDIQENNNCLNFFEIPSSISFNSSTKPSATSVYDHFHFSPIDERLIHQTKNEIDPLTYPSFHNYSSSSASSTSGSSTTHSPRSSSHLLDNYTYQRQILSSSLTQQKLNQLNLTRIQTAKTIPSFSATQTYPTTRFSSQYYSRNPFSNICQQTRSTPPMFTPPFQITRERFQVNSIGRPILRANNYNHLSQVHPFKIRR